MTDNVSGRVGDADQALLASLPEPVPVSALSGDDPSRCATCGGDGWVCEDHRDEPAFSGCCGGAGAPCGSCNLEMASAGFVDRREKSIAAWLRAQPPSYSGWNDHDEIFDLGWNGAIEWVASNIQRGKHWADASAIEARSVETGTGSTEGKSATPEGGDAQTEPSA